MLVLSRKRHEKLVIGDNIVIEVVRLSSDAVRLGITAPNDVKIVRTELIEKDAEESPPPSLAQWMEDYDDAVEAGQSWISREEAEKRYYKRFGNDSDRRQNGDW